MQKTYKWKKMKNWSSVWNPVFIWHTVDGWGLRASRIRYIFTSIQKDFSNFISYTCQSTDSLQIRWFLKLLGSEKGFPKDMFSKRVGIKKDGWFLWGGWTISSVIGDCSVMFWGWNFHIWSSCEGGGVAACGALALRRYAFAVYSEEGKVTCCMVVVVMF